MNYRAMMNYRTLVCFWHAQTRSVVTIVKYKTFIGITISDLHSIPSLISSPRSWATETGSFQRDMEVRSVSSHCVFPFEHGLIAGINSIIDALHVCNRGHWFLKKKLATEHIKTVLRIFFLSTWAWWAYIVHPESEAKILTWCSNDPDIVVPMSLSKLDVELEDLQDPFVTESLGYDYDKVLDVLQRRRLDRKLRGN